MVDRHDHFAHMKAQPEPVVEPDGNVPPVAPELVEYLDVRFGPLAQLAMVRAAKDGQEAACVQITSGWNTVLNHLRQLSIAQTQERTDVRPESA